MKELKIFRITDAGPKDNEDSCFVVQYGTSAALACMADGVGGLNRGELASRFITRYVEDWYEEEGERLFRMSGEEVQMRMTDLVMSIHEDLLALSEEKGITRFGSTIDLAVIGNRKMFITHVGDSRVYLFDGKEVRQITTDMTLEEYEKTTGMKVGGVDKDRKPHTLMQCLGNGEIAPYQYEVDIPGSCDIILCSDGLTNRLTTHDIRTELKKKQLGSDALVHLVEQAREAGEGDNITAILIRRRDLEEKKKKQHKKKKQASGT